MTEQSTKVQGETVDGSDSTARTPAIEIIDIRKTFPGVVANDSISLSVWPGEVYCLLGENGAGKSTLMQILSGMYQADAGIIRVGGREVRMDSPREALELGVGMVYQHPTLIPVFTVIENLLLGSRSGLTLDYQGALQRFSEHAEKLGVEIDPGSLVGGLALGQQQQVEIIKALWKGSSVLILDEPTSMLTPQGIKELREVVEQLKHSGLAVIFITHKLHEALDMADRISVLRRGRLVGSIAPSVLRNAERSKIQSMVIEMMFGEEKTATNVVEVKDQVTGKSLTKDLTGQPVLELVNVYVKGEHDEIGAQGVSFSLRAGEVLGVAGVDGNGQRELAEAIAGQRRITSGDILLNGISVSGGSVSDRQRLGLRYVTDDRMGEGIGASLSVGRNLFLKRIGQRPFWTWGRTNEGVIRETAENLIEEYDIRTPGVESNCGVLSGGNIQKVLLARELMLEPKVVLYSKPTHGLDVKTTGMVRDRIRSLAEEEGVAELLISTDLDEVLDLSDRIAIMYQGRISGIVENQEGIEKIVGELMVGGTL